MSQISSRIPNQTSCQIPCIHRNTDTGTACGVSTQSFNLQCYLTLCVKRGINPQGFTIAVLELLICDVTCVFYRELELSSVSQTTEGEGLSLHHTHLICGAHPLGPSSSPTPPLCHSSPCFSVLTSSLVLICSSSLSLQPVPVTFGTTKHTEHCTHS